jgi:hypothetical protein
MLSDFDKEPEVFHNKVLVTLAIGKYVRLMEFARPSLANYAKTWGYDLIEITHSWDTSRPHAWTKILAIRELLDRYDFVFYVDSDALILRNDEDIESEFDHDFAWPVGPVNGKTCPNAGIMAIRSSTRTKQLFDLAYQQEDLIFNGWWEQAALLRVLQYEDPREGEKHWKEFDLESLEISVFELDSRWNSTIPGMSSNPIIRHFAGDPWELKLALMSEYALSRTFFLPESTFESGKTSDAEASFIEARNGIFQMRLGLTQRLSRLPRRIWSKLSKTTPYKYK